MSSEDAGNPEQAGPRQGIGGVGERVLVRQPRAGLVRAIDGRSRQHLRRRCDPGGVDAMDLFGVLDHVRQLVDETVFFGVAQFEARERGDPIHVGAREPLWHARCYHATL